MIARAATLGNRTAAVCWTVAGTGIVVCDNGRLNVCKAWVGKAGVTAVEGLAWSAGIVGKCDKHTPPHD